MKRFISIFLILAMASLAQAQEKFALIHGPYIQNVTDTEATVVWIASNESIGWLELAPDDGTDFYDCARDRYYDCRNGIKTRSRIHKVRLTGLTPGVTYRYRVYATEITGYNYNFVSYGRTVATQVYHREPLRLTTFTSDPQSVSFAMVNDIHGDNEKFEHLLSLCDMDATDMILFVGDMVTAFNGEEKIFGGFMDKAVELFASEKPMFYTRGNHETRGETAYAFQEYFSPSQEHIYYMKRVGPVCFIALDSGEDKPDTDMEYYGINVYDQYRDEQADWLREVVKSEEFKSAPFKIVTCHIPPVGGWHGDREVLKKFVPILNEAGVDVMLSGHTHKRYHLKPGEVSGFPVIINSNKDLVKCTVTKDKLDLQIVNPDGKVIDTLTIKK